MSVPDGSTLDPKDPHELLVYTMDWSDFLTTPAIVVTSTWTITGPDAILTKDTPTIAADGLSTLVRLAAGTANKKYKVTNTIVTNESPAQTGERSFYLPIKDL